MAITGRFQADFSNFLDAMDQAVVKTVDLSKGASGVEAKLNSMVDSFSGRKIIQDTSLMAAAFLDAGGAASFTTAELQKMGAKADEAIAKLQATGRDVPVTFQQISDAAAAAGHSFQEFGANFDIKEAIENPLKTAGEGVKALAAELGPAGVAAVGFATGIVAVGVALFELTKFSAEVGGRLNDVSDVTSEAVPKLSRLSNAAQVVGSDLGTMSNAMFIVNKNMEESPDKFQRGLARLNLDLATFRDLSPADQLQAIAGALKTTEDPVERTAAGFELMGRQFRDLEPALLKLDAGLSATADIAPWTTEQAQAAEDFEQQLASLKVHMEAIGIAIGRNLIGPISTLTGILPNAVSWLASLAGGFGGVLTPIYYIKEGLDLGAAVLEVFGITAGKTGEAVKSLAEKQKELNDRIKDAANTPDASLKRWHDAAAGLAVTMQTVNDKAKQQAILALELDNQTKAHIESTTKANKANADWAAVIDNVESSGVSWQATLAGVDGQVLEGIKYYEAGGAKLGDLAKYYGLTATQANAFAESQKAAAAATKEFEAEVKKVEQDFDNAKGFQALSKFGTTVDLKPFDLVVDKVHGIETGFYGVGSAIAQVGEKVKPAMSDLDSLPVNLIANLEKAAAGIPSIFVKAFTGGGGVVGAIQGSIATLGNSVSSSLGKMIAEATAKAGADGFFSSGLGKVVTSAIPVIGPLIGSLAGPLISGLKSLFSGGAEAAINPVRQAFVDAAGGLSVLNAHASQVGLTLDRLLNAKNQEQYTAAVNELNKAFADQKTKIDADTAALGDLTKQAEDLAGTLAPTMKDAVDKMIALAQETGNTQDVLAGLAGVQTVSFKDLSDLATKYGADLTALGPKFQQARISDTANGIINDFDTLNRGLGDTDAALTVMRKPINDLVNDSIKFGTTIPENMKPWIEQLEKTGQLTDANGDKIDDLSAIKFGDPIKTEFQKIIDKLQELIDKIAETKQGIDVIPTKKTIEFTTIHNDVYDDSGRSDATGAAMGGLARGYGVQYMSGGGKLLAMTPRGGDVVPAMLGVGEGVVSERGMRTLGEAELARINAGYGSGAGGAADTQALQDEISGLRQDMADQSRLLPKLIRDAVLLAPRRAA